MGGSWEEREETAAGRRGPAPKSRVVLDTFVHDLGAGSQPDRFLSYLLASFCLSLAEARSQSHLVVEICLNSEF